MSVFVKAIPTLCGEVADRFVKISEANLARRTSFEKSTEPRRARLASDILTNLSATSPQSVGIAFTKTDIPFTF